MKNRRALILGIAIAVTAGAGVIAAMDYAASSASVLRQMSADASALVRKEGPRFVAAADFADADPAHTAKVFGAFWSDVQLPEYAHMRVWDPRGRVIWADEAELIGQKPAQSPEAERALRGEAASAVVFRQGTLIETYVPFAGAGGRVAGLIDLYRNPGAYDAAVSAELAGTLPLPVGLAAVVDLVAAYYLFRAAGGEKRPAASTPPGAW